MGRFMTGSGVLLAVATTWLAMAAPTQASVVIAATRVVYHAGDREITLKLSNQGEQPSLVEVWADQGNAKSTPDTADAPFLIMPPISRVDPGKSQTLRITYAPDARVPLSPDHESLFWLNVLDVPPQPKQKSGDPRSYVQVVMRSRLKLFYRPPGLAGSPDDAAAQLSWKIVPAAPGHGYILRGHNAGAYYVSLNKTDLIVSGTAFHYDGGTLAPGGDTDIPLASLRSKPHGVVTVNYESINDYGAVVSHSAQLTL